MKAKKISSKLFLVVTSLLVVTYTLFNPSLYLGQEKSDTIVSCIGSDISVSATSCIVLESESNSILYSKNAYDKMSMASTTKIMTAIIALESEQLDEVVTITKEMCYVEGSSLYLKIGDKINLYNLVIGLLCESGNDCANAIAITIGGTIENFVDIMNFKAKELLLENTSFETPSGLDGENHYTTAFDLASLTRYALENNHFKKIVSSKNINVEFVEPTSSSRELTNHNRLLRELEGCIGVKTGFTKKSGRCLVSASERDGITIIVVTLNAPNDWDDHKKLTNLAFEDVQKITLGENNFNLELDIVGSLEQKGQAKISKQFNCTILKSELNSIMQKVEIEPFYYAPIKSGDYAGRIIYYIGDRVLGEVPLVFLCDYPYKELKKNIFQKILGWFI